jgi:uncharacterized membrane protein
MSPAGLAKVFAALALIVLVIGAGFALAGAWLVLPFAGLEVALLIGAYLFYARHAADYERISLGDGRLTIEIAEGIENRSVELDATRVRLSMAEDERLLLQAAEERIEIGRHLDAERRVEFAGELAKKLQA